MGTNVQLVRSIKRYLSEVSSDELRKMLEERDVSRYSDEAFITAQEIMEERARGQLQEPPPKTPPPPKPTPAQLEAAEDALLRRQVRLIGAYYYFLACWWIFFGLLLLEFVALRLHLFLDGILKSLVLIIPGVLFWLLGWSLRRFSPFARIMVMFISILQMPSIPIGTIIGLYCWDKLIRANKLFGAKRHPGERVTPQ
jgi:hypothetical protein